MPGGNKIAKDGVSFNGRRPVTAQEKLIRFEQQISPHLRSAYNLARWLTGSHEDAEDVVQEAFLRAFSAFDNLRNDDGKAWLLAIVRNTSLTLIRRNRTAPTIVGQEQHVEDPSEPSPNPEEMLLISRHREDVRRALEQLPAEFREAIVLRELEGLAYKEIAATAGVPVGTVMSRLSRGREWLRRILSNPREGVQQKRSSAG
jgi:RNA polymerase sigma-70 factor (ECF subfamily)